MHLVDEQHRAPAFGEPVRRLGEYLPDLGQAREHRRDGAELGFGVPGQQQSERRLAAPWRPPQDHRMHPPRLHRPAQRRARRQEPTLADHVVKRPRPHALGQGPHRVAIGGQQVRRIRGWGSSRTSRHCTVRWGTGSGRHDSKAADPGCWAKGLGTQNPHTPTAPSGAVDELETCRANQRLATRWSAAHGCGASPSS